MCGVLGTTKKIEEKKFVEALDLISHRGPDSSGFLSVKGVFLGHKRLSIIDLSIMGNQPMSDGSGEFYIIFNGEIYNFLKLREDLEKEGVVFKSRTDTEVILNGYKKYGTSFFEKMRGMWAFAIFDKRNNEIILSRDYFGIKPLYYHHDDKGVSFCSELRPLSKFINFVPDKEAYTNYYSFGTMLFDMTGVLGVKQVLPGEVVSFSLSSGKISRFVLDLKNESLSVKYKNLEEAISESVKYHYVSDVPVSILFSGGVDSTLIALLSKKLGFRPICFSVEMEGSKDGYYSDQIAQKIGLNVEKIYFNEDSFENIYKDVLSKLDIPISDISILPTYAVFNSVRNKTKVALSGEGGDELFGGYLRHKFLYGTKIRKTSFILPKLYKDNYFGLTFISPIEYRIQKIINKITKDTITTYATNSLTFYDPEILKKSVFFLRQINRRNIDMFPDSLFFDMSVYLPYMLMLKGDRSSMFNSVEGRVPFLDKNLFNYVSYLYYKGGTRLFFKEELKRILAEDLPTDLVYRKKQGFGVPKKFFGKGFLDDFILAFEFHKKNEKFFGKIPFADIKDMENFNLVVKKYPRFAFGLITSFYVWKSYGL